MMFKKILVPVDSSGTSMRGLDEAIRVAKATGATLRLVHVVNELILDANYASSMYYDKVIESVRQVGKQALETAGERTKAGQVAFETEMIETIGGRAADEIVREAKRCNADLIVMGTHGRRGFSRLALGSDAELVLRSTPVPVLMIRDQSQRD
jgi:nucleotide-binding universal stress UspA family protein